MLIINGMDLDIKRIDFTNYDVVRNLIFKRQEIFSIVLHQPNSNFLEYETSNRDFELIETVKDVYTRLDTYIEFCNFNEFNSDLINRLSNGETVKDISIAKKASERTIFNRLRRVVLKINSVAIDRRFKM